VLTVTGDSFANRVVMSLLDAFDLERNWSTFLVASSAKEYVDMALQLISPVSPSNSILTAHRLQQRLVRQLVTSHVTISIDTSCSDKVCELKKDADYVRYLLAGLMASKEIKHLFEGGGKYHLAVISIPG
jgi:hypothetical protein